LDFLDEKPQWTGDQIHRPLLELWLALSDLDKGRRVPLLTPTTFPSRHPENALGQMSRGHAIVAVEQLVGMGERVVLAAEQVTKVWNKCTGATRKSATIKSWYDRRNKEHKDHDLAFEVLAKCRALWNPENLSESSANAVRDVLRKSGLSDNLEDYLPHTAANVLEFLERTLTVIKPGKS
jgi:hypothetical protein